MEKINAEAINTAAITNTTEEAATAVKEGKVIQISDISSRKTRERGLMYDCRDRNPCINPEIIKPGFGYENDIDRIWGGDHSFNDSPDTVSEVVKHFTDLMKEALAMIRYAYNDICDMKKGEEIEDESPVSGTEEIPEEPEVVSDEEISADPEIETKDIKNKVSTNLTKSGEFLWKPESDKDGKLAILLPGKLTGKVKKVRIVDTDGNLLAKGKYSGKGNRISQNEREHYRFDKAGSKFPDGATVEITLNNGNTKKVKIKETSERKVH